MFFCRKNEVRLYLEKNPTLELKTFLLTSKKYLDKQKCKSIESADYTSLWD